MPVLYPRARSLTFLLLTSAISNHHTSACLFEKVQGEAISHCLETSNIGMQMITSIVLLRKLGLIAGIADYFGEVDGKIECSAVEDPVINLLSRLISGWV